MNLHRQYRNWAQLAQPIYKEDDQHAREKYLEVLGDDDREQTIHLLPSGMHAICVCILLKAAEGEGG